MRNNESDKQFFSRTILIEGGKAKHIAVGAYSDDEPIPEFDITTEPNIQDLLSASIERMNIPGKRRYAMMCQLHNYGDKQCKVTILRRGAATTK